MTSEQPGRRHVRARRALSRTPSAGLVLLALTLAAVGNTDRARADMRVVSRAEILEAMKASRGFDPATTTNGARFQSEVLLTLVRQAQARAPEGPPLFIGHAEWFAAFLERTGLTADRAPTFVVLPHQYRQDMEVDYRSAQVLKETSGLRPQVAANVRIWWPAVAGGPKEYSYRDTLSRPELKVTNKRVVSYRLLAFDDMTMFAQIEGLWGRPTSGVLGLLFKLLGEGQVVENRMAISADGIQVARARAEKSIFPAVTQTVTVYPDGRMEKDVPSDRPDLAALDARLRRPLALKFQPLPSDR